MPPAVVAQHTALSGSVLSQLLAQSQAMSAQNNLANLRQASLPSLHNALAQQMMTSDPVFGQMAWVPDCTPSKVIPAWKIERGEKLCNRIAFWREIPVIGTRIAGGLADKLDQVSAELEACA